MNILDKIRGMGGESTGTQGSEYSSHVVLLEIEVYEEVGKVANYLTEEKSIIINVKTLSDENVKRVVSFLEGALFIVGGEMKQLDDRTFLCVPNSVAIVDEEEEEEQVEEQEQEEPIAEEETMKEESAGSSGSLDEELEAQQKQVENM